ncbi:hypothetical protein SRB17_63750 [Streptomyces sp. RB17]|nr:hypothetical protein [Streptomyces sp. RB17]
MIAVRGSTGAYPVEQARPRKTPGASTESAGGDAHPQQLLRQRSPASRCGGPGSGTSRPPGRPGPSPSPTARGACEGPSRVRWWKRFVAGLSGIAPFLRRHSVGVAETSRDADQPPSVHLSGGTPGWPLPPYDLCPAGRPTGRRHVRGAASAEKATPCTSSRLRPSPPTTNVRPWDSRVWSPPDGADVTARQAIAAPPSPRDLGPNSAPGHDRPRTSDPELGRGRPGEHHDQGSRAPFPVRIRRLGLARPRRPATGSVTSYDATETKNGSRSCAPYENEAEPSSMRPGKGVFIVRQTTMIAACPTTRQPFRPSPSPWTWSC